MTSGSNSTGSATPSATRLTEVRVEDAVGLALAHDLTRIVPGEFKGRLFRKGHVVREEDIPELHKIGKAHIYVLQLGTADLHEDEAAQRMAAAAGGAGLAATEPSEGKVLLRASAGGLARVAKPFIDDVNGIGQLAMATLTDCTVVRSGQTIAGTRVIPLVVERERVERVEAAAAVWREAHGGAAPIHVLPFRPLRVGLVTTGGEVFSGLIEDKFGPVVRARVEAFGSAVVEQRFSPDDSEAIVREIRYFLELGVDLILITGGMSVDPDDRTPGAIKQAGARIVSHGTPMLPGSMLMMAYLGDTPVMGLPGGVIHDKFTVFDVLLPRVCAGVAIERNDIVQLGYGGLFADRG
ncbi:molybdopterin-binding protein [Paenibacillus koleovorans]|uniref:molybdopterin-binding protein n=1 Tax=Paenibacillus koleovorans TaxID=121608 RepID=UPI000FD7BD05|nr:molybdopterin-binding protein [Paenibacillus koleovorans]